MSLAPVESEVILFLNPTPSADGYNVAWGPAGTLQVSADGTVPLSTPALRRLFVGRSQVGLNDMLMTVRDLATRQ
jgi:hypothetical protein